MHTPPTSSGSVISRISSAPLAWISSAIEIIVTPNVTT